jgi:hypothetical protein
VTTNHRSARSRPSAKRRFEHRGRVEEDLECEHRLGGGTEGGELEQHRRRDLDRMETGAGGDIDVEIGVMHPVQAPQHQHGMEQHVLQV